MQKNNRKSGFTLIELSIVMVIIGLIIGGVLVGQDLINAATIRAQISQIEKYQTAVHTFQLKYGYLPGDIPDPAASAFGFNQRGASAGQGNGNGIIDSFQLAGENAMFWEDLSKANLIEGSFSTATYNSPPCGAGLSVINTSLYLPKSKIGGNGNGYVYVWSGGWQKFGVMASDGNNYFGVTGVAGCTNWGTILPVTNMTVGQAYSIDTKIDDGLPQSGNVTTMGGGYGMEWAVGGPLTTSSGMTYVWASGDADGNTSGPITPAASPPQWADAPHNSTIDQLCYSNGDNVNVTETYNMKYPNNLNCVLSFKFQ